jgi:predicted kinase
MVRLDDFFRGECEGLDYGALHDAFDWVRAMADTPQDPQYHGEGDVWTHTRMVCDALTRDEQWAALSADQRRLMLTAALLHDAGKPDVTFTDDNGRIRSPDHARRGAAIARRLLWELEEPFAFREHVVALVRQHMQPRHLPRHRDPRRRVFALSCTLRCDWLAMLARADARGRVANDFEDSLRWIDRFVRFCARNECLTTPRSFASDHARFLYFRRMLDHPDAAVPEPTGPTVVVMSGLPGSGKDSWIAPHRAGRAVISLDRIRAEIGVSPQAAQEPVVKLARERAEGLLADGCGFIWNATTLGPRHRASLLELIRPWDPRVDIVYVEAPPSLLLHRNRARSGSAVVPEDVIWRMTGIWQPPDITEAHTITHVLHASGSAERMAS